MGNNNRVMVMLTPEELERLGYGAQPKNEEENDDNRTAHEKMSDFASTRDRDSQGRFLSKKEMERAELEAFYYSPHRIVYKPKYGGPDHVLVRQEELYWYQKAHVIAGLSLGGLGIYGLLIGIWEGFKALVFG